MTQEDDSALLKVGELARRAGLTVRALHHYDSIGLLRPSARAASGYRLYNRADVARLQQIQALRRFDLPLARIAAHLDDPALPLADLIGGQIAALDRQLEQAGRLREQLTRLQHQLARSEQPALADWLSTLERMALYDQYFDAGELARLPLAWPDRGRSEEWETLAGAVRAAMARGLPPQDRAPQMLARRWMALLERDTAANPQFAQRVGAMMAQEQAARRRAGVSVELKQYVMDAFAAYKLTVYAAYLNPDELRVLRENGARHGHAWLEVIAAMHRQLEAGAAPCDGAVQELTRQWLALTRLRVGDDPATLAKLRLAYQREPALLAGTWITPAMLELVRASAATLPAG